MNYNFDIEVAKEYGVNEAIMIANFQHWIRKNKANGKNFYDGHWWTYNSKKAFTELFPFWTEQNIKTILNHLKDKGVLITCNYNENQYDRTLWYAFVDEDKWIGENQPMHKLELTNGEVRTNQAIPNIKPDILNNNIINKPQKIKQPPTLEEINKYIQEKKLNVDGQRFFDYYSEGDWKDSNGKPIRNWKQKMLAVWDKPKIERIDIGTVKSFW